MEIYKLFMIIILVHGYYFGDFNEICSSNEKFGGAPINIKRSSNFNKCLNNIKMIDLEFLGPHFTWTTNLSLITKNHPKSIIIEQLDKFFANNKWVELFQDSTVKHLLCTHSDHCPTNSKFNKTLLKNLC